MHEPELPLHPSSREEHAPSPSSPPSTPVPVPMLEARRHPVAVTEQMKNAEPKTQVGKIVLFVLIKPTEEAKTQTERD